MGEIQENMVENGGQRYRVSIYAPLVRNASGELVKDTATIEAYTELAHFLLTGLYGLCGRGVPPFCVKIAEVSPDDLDDIHTAVEIATVDPKADDLDIVRSDTGDATHLVALQNYFAEIETAENADAEGKTVEAAATTNQTAETASAENVATENANSEQDYYGAVKIDVFMIDPKAECGKPPYNNFAARALAQMAYCEYAACITKYFPKWHTRYDDGLFTEFLGTS